MFLWVLLFCAVISKNPAKINEFLWERTTSQKKKISVVPGSQGIVVVQGSQAKQLLAMNFTVVMFYWSSKVRSITGKPTLIDSDSIDIVRT